MLDIKIIRNNPDIIKKSCENKNVQVDIDRLLEIDKKRINLLKLIENINYQKNRSNEKIKDADEKNKLIIIEEMRSLKEKEDVFNEEYKVINKEFQHLMFSIPNPAFETVPIGKNDSENIVLKQIGEKTKFSFNPKNYLDIAENLDVIDVKRAAKTSGTRFGYLKGDIALMEFALIQLAMKIAIKNGFIPVIPPVMIKPEMMEKMGYIKQSLNDKWDNEEIYFLKDDPLLLVGTSEQSIGPMHADEIFEKKDLPLRYIGFSSCFRREAGSYGKDTKGILRVHQFDKIEMFTYCLPEESKNEHQILLSIEEEIMQNLKIPYQVLDICTGDLGDPAASKYDIEAWMPGQGEYRETHSTSNCTDFQSRRLNIRYRDNNNLEFIHMLNGTAIAVGRIIIAIIENYQNEDGSITVPEVLRSYLGKDIIKKRD